KAAEVLNGRASPAAGTGPGRVAATGPVKAALGSDGPGWAAAAPGPGRVAGRGLARAAPVSGGPVWPAAGIVPAEGGPTAQATEGGRTVQTMASARETSVRTSAITSARETSGKSATTWELSIRPTTAGTASITSPTPLASTAPRSITGEVAV